MTARTIVVGLGNPILGDDGAGWKVADIVESKLFNSTINVTGEYINSQGQDVRIEHSSSGGLTLMEKLIGFDRAIIIDTLKVNLPVGTIQVFPMDELTSNANHTNSVHDTNLPTAMELGRKMGTSLPLNVIVVGIAVQECLEFCEFLSPPVNEAIPAAVNIVLDLIKTK